MIGQEENISFYFPAEGNIEAPFNWVPVSLSRLDEWKRKYATCTTLFAPKNFAKELFSISLGTAVISRKNEKQRLRKIWEAIKVHYG